MTTTLGCRRTFFGIQRCVLPLCYGEAFKYFCECRQVLLRNVCMHCFLSCYHPLGPLYLLLWFREQEDLTSLTGRRGFSLTGMVLKSEGSRNTAPLTPKTPYKEPVASTSASSASSGATSTGTSGASGNVRQGFSLTGMMFQSERSKSPVGAGAGAITPPHPADAVPAAPVTSGEQMPPPSPPPQRRLSNLGYSLKDLTIRSERSRAMDTSATSSSSSSSLPIYQNSKANFRGLSLAAMTLQSEGKSKRQAAMRAAAAAPPPAPATGIGVPAGVGLGASPATNTIAPSATAAATPLELSQHSSTPEGADWLGQTNAWVPASQLRAQRAAVAAAAAEANAAAAKSSTAASSAAAATAAASKDKAVQEAAAKLKAAAANESAAREASAAAAATAAAAAAAAVQPTASTQGDSSELLVSSVEAVKTPAPSLPPLDETPWGTPLEPLEARSPTEVAAAAAAPAPVAPAVPTATPANSAVDGLATELSELVKCKVAGLLSDAEFSAAKTAVLASRKLVAA